jgi:hypothetical protein
MSKGASVVETREVTASKEVSSESIYLKGEWLDGIRKFRTSRSLRNLIISNFLDPFPCSFIESR